MTSPKQCHSPYFAVGLPLGIPTFHQLQAASVPHLCAWNGSKPIRPIEFWHISWQKVKHQLSFGAGYIFLISFWELR
jgi:hypothetical protein